MIVIKSIEFEYVEGDFVKYHQLKSVSDFPRKHDPIVSKNDHIEVEVIQSHRFRNPQSGEDIYIGIQEDVAEILGLQYDAFEQLQENQACLTLEAASLSKEYDNILLKHADLLKTILDFNDSSWLKRLFTFKLY